VELLCRRLALRGLTVETAIEAGDNDVGVRNDRAGHVDSPSALRVHRDAVQVFRQTVGGSVVCLPLGWKGRVSVVVPFV
jgi:hypothetical protein